MSNGSNLPSLWLQLHGISSRKNGRVIMIKNKTGKKDCCSYMNSPDNESRNDGLWNHGTTKADYSTIKERKMSILSVLRFAELF